MLLRYIQVGEQMHSEEVRLILIRQTQAIRKALYVIECNLGFYQRLVAEEERKKANVDEFGIDKDS